MTLNYLTFLLLNVYGFGQLREGTLILVNRKSAEGHLKYSVGKGFSCSDRN